MIAQNLMPVFEGEILECTYTIHVCGLLEARSASSSDTMLIEKGSWVRDNLLMYM